MLKKNRELSAIEYRALNMIVSPVSRTDLPEALQRFCDGKKNFLECVKLFDRERKGKTSPEELDNYIKILRAAAQQEVLTIAPASVTTAEEFAAALQTLGVTGGMQLVVHSTFSAFGSVPEGAEAFCKKLQQAIGENGTLLMPAFTFQVYHPGSKENIFDVRNTPSTVGILTDTFRKMPGVLRSFDPCHSFAVWGKDAEYFVKDHHLASTIDHEFSPLGKLFKADGWCLTISSALYVTFMHLVEEMNGAKCCSKRTEEYRTILPDGQEVLTRAWGWRGTTCKECPANDAEAVFNIMRKENTVRETMVNNAHLQLFKLDDYRKAYSVLMQKFCRNAASFRVVACTVASDWDDELRQLKPSLAYKGKWFSGSGE